MVLNSSILEDVRVAMGLSRDSPDFDTELLMLINSGIGRLNQNGIGNNLVVADSVSTWGDLQSQEQLEHNDSFKMVPLFISLSTKLIFDPPPPSAVEHFSNTVEQLLWRLKIAYEEQYTTTTTTSIGDW